MPFILQTLITPAGVFYITAGCHSFSKHSLLPPGYFQSQLDAILQTLIMPVVYSIRSFRRFCTPQPYFIIGTTNSQASLECCASPVKIIMSWNVFGLPFYIIIKIFKQSKENKGNAKRGVFPRLTIWHGDLWPWKSIWFLILLRTTYIPSLLKIHWRMWILVFTWMLRRTDRR